MIVGGGDTIFSLTRNGNQVAVSFTHYLTGHVYMDEEYVVYFSGRAGVAIGSQSGSDSPSNSADGKLDINFSTTLSPGTATSGSYFVEDNVGFDIAVNFTTVLFNAAANYTGTAGVDYVFGSSANDVFRGGGGNDGFDGGKGADSISGEQGDDHLFGEDGNDHLNGGLGADHLNGGFGFDFATYATATAGVTARLYNSALNAGEAAGDTYVSIEGIAGSNFNDTLYGFTNSNRLYGRDGSDSLFGLDGSDSLYGEGGSDYLNGGLGADVLNGGAGIDYASYSLATSSVIARLDNPSANIREAAGDIYVAIEGLIGSNYADLLCGNNLDNPIYGRDGGDRIYGFGGNDFLVGNAGNDILTGGAHSDNFVFDTALNEVTNIDIITDFNVSADTIRLENAIFAKLTTTGTLNTAFFRVDSAALDANDYIVYNSATGALIYDSNGNVGGGAVQFAQLSTGLALTNLDFVVI